MKKRTCLLQVLNNAIFGNELLTLCLVVLLCGLEERLFKVLLINVQLGLVGVSRVQTQLNY